MDPLVDRQSTEVRDEGVGREPATGAPVGHPEPGAEPVSTSIPFGTTSTGPRNGFRARETRASRAAAEGAVATSHLQYVPRLSHEATAEERGDEKTRRDARLHLADVRVKGSYQRKVEASRGEEPRAPHRSRGVEWRTSASPIARRSRSRANGLSAHRYPGRIAGPVRNGPGSRSPRRVPVARASAAPETGFGAKTWTE